MMGKTRIGPTTHKHFDSNERIEEMERQQAETQSILAAESTYDLDDQEKSEALRERGIRLQQGEKAHMKARENASTGYSWILDAEACAAKVEVLSEFVAVQ